MTTGLVQNTTTNTEIATYINTSNNGIVVDQTRPMSATLSIDYTKVQEKLTAGSNISISGATISATDTTYTAGQNITIDANNVISASTDSVYEKVFLDNTPGASRPTFNDVKAIIDNGKIPVLVLNSIDGNYTESITGQVMANGGVYQFAGCSTETENNVSFKTINFMRISAYGRSFMMYLQGVDENDTWFMSMAGPITGLNLKAQPI